MSDTETLIRVGFNFLSQKNLDKDIKNFVIFKDIIKKQILQ